ncbi:hypothetical protein BCY84_04196 [Trypanosoma cruzi cruzi]|nr:hypothetical protein BCY84_04196 [Trypanosoma cruzi cruzi]
MKDGRGGLVGKDEAAKETRLSWAEKARRQMAAERRYEEKDEVNQHCIVHLLNMEAQEELRAENYPCGGFLVPLQALPLDVWDIITLFLTFRDVQLLSSTCRFFWVQLHRRESIWRFQLERFRSEMTILRSDRQLLCMEFLKLSSCTAYERLKLERKLYALDARREWHFRESEKPDRSIGIFSCPLIFNASDDNSENHNPSSLGEEEEEWALLRIRVLRPTPRSTSLLGTCAPSSDGNRFDHIMSRRVDSIYTPSEYLTICDNINHGDFTWSRMVVQDCTADEDGLLLFALLQTLRRAKRRPIRHSSGNEPQTSYHLILRRFRGTLLAICRYEAEQILKATLHMPRILDDFFIFNDLSWTGSGDAAGLVPLLQTLYFIAPELCHRGRVGLIVVDPVRVLVVVGKECVTRDDPQWDEVYTTALETGRPPQGSGMNPQPSGRV